MGQVYRDEATCENAEVEHVSGRAPASSVEVSSDGPVTVVAISRPERRNAVDSRTAADLREAFEAFEVDDSACVAVLTGSGGTFCAGADLKAMAEGDRRPVRDDGPGPMGPTRLDLTKPVVAAIEGHAVAGGLELALWCDLRVAATDAVLGVYCRRFGVPLVDGGSVRLARLIGQSHALDLLLTGRGVGGPEALAMGLVNRLAPHGESLASPSSWPCRSPRSRRCACATTGGRCSTSGAFPSAMRSSTKLVSVVRRLPAAKRQTAHHASRGERAGTAPLSRVPPVRERPGRTTRGAKSRSRNTPCRRGVRFRRDPHERRFSVAISRLHRWTRPCSVCGASGSSKAFGRGRRRRERKRFRQGSSLFAHPPWPRRRLEVSRDAEKFGLAHFQRRARKEVRARLEWHKARGHLIVVVSASPEIYVRAVAAELGADAVIATRLEVGQDGRLTGHYEGKNCRGPEKERRLREWIAGAASDSADRARGEPFVWAYGNSAGDLEMLRDADVGVNVGRLGQLGKLRGFRSLASVTGSGQPGTDAAPTTLPS